MVGNEQLQTSNLDGFEVVNSDVTIGFRQFFRSLYDYEGQNVAFFNFLYLCDPESN